MTSLRALCLIVQASCLALTLTLGAAHAQSAAETGYQPTVGQDGKDVVWIPTAQTLVDRMLDMAKVTPNDILVDLGSGDGRTVITAAKRGVSALGIEFNPDMVVLSQAAAKAEGVGDTARFVQGDIFEVDFTNATVVTMFLLPALNQRLRPQLLKMKPGTRLVSNTFDMGDWVPDDRIDASVGCISYCRAYLWIVPANVEGAWRLPQGRLTLTQNYQMLTGTLTVGGKRTPISQGRMIGEAISFVIGARTITGRVRGNTIEFAKSPGPAWGPARR
jgi:hypothetical protein